MPSKEKVRDIKGHFVKPDDATETSEGTSEQNSEGCLHCDSTGLEPGYGRSEAPYCSECKGSPFLSKSTSNGFDEEA